jgi:hypothetical protein
MNKLIILKFALLGLCFAVSFRTAFAADATKPSAKPPTTTSPASAVFAQKPQAGRAESVSIQEKITKASASTATPSLRKGGISRFSHSDDALGRHVSRFSGPPGPTLTLPGATFLRTPLTSAQMGQIFSESVEIGEGELLHDFPPGTVIRKVVVTQTAQRN